MGDTLSPIEVSVITSAYNAEGTLARMLDSLLAQTYSHWECVVVDDGSTDGTLALAEEYAWRDERIKPVQLMSNVGMAAARNNGIGFASYDWLSFLDADDTYDPRHFEAMVAVLGDDVDMAWCNYRLLCMDGTVWEVGEYRPPELVEGKMDFFEAATYYCPIHISAAVVRKSLVQVVGGFQYNFVCCADQLLWQRLGRIGARFIFVQGNWANYHLRLGSCCRDRVVECFEEALKILRLGYTDDSHAPGLRLPLSGSYPVSALFYVAAVAVVGFLVAGRDISSFARRVEDERRFRNYTWDGRITVGDILWDVNYIPLSATCLPFEWNGETWVKWGPLVDRFLNWVAGFLGRWDGSLVPEARRIMEEQVG